MPEKPKDLMNYEGLAQEALRGVVRSALKKAAAPKGLPGEHHFYISFRTDHKGVSVPADLLAKYPEEMTIVLRQSYRDLAPGETFFTVTLEFGGQPKNLSIPYAAITRFYDPSVQFLLQFEAVELPAEGAAATPLTPPKPLSAKSPAEKSKPAAPGSDPAPAAPATGEAPNVVSLDQFRKK